MGSEGDATRGATGHCGLLVDYGGVLTTSVGRSFVAWCERSGLPSRLAVDTLVGAYRDHDGNGPVQHVEMGLLSGEEFASLFAAELSRRAGTEVAPDGLVEALFAEVKLDERMLGAVLAARRAGVRTGLLSNSWGREGYPRERFAELFDAVVISGEVGLRKPDPAIFTLAAGRLGLPPADCVFVDDLDVNVRAAEAGGMAGVHHRSAEETLPRLAALLGLEPSLLGA